jgi:hypothetical protein
MMAQQSFQKPLTLQIDLNQATFQAFLNCINSFQGLETESEMRSTGGSAISSMSSKVSIERFIDNLGVLSGLTDQDGYDSEMEPKDAFIYWRKMVKYLKESGFFKHARRISHL